MATFLYRLGHGCVRHRRIVLGVWLTLLIGLGVLGSIAGGETSDELTLPGTESQEAFDLLDATFAAQGGSSTRVVFAAPEGSSLSNPTVMSTVDEVMSDIGTIEGVSAVAPPSDAGTVSPDATVAFGDVRYPVGSLEVEDSTLDAVETSVKAARDAGISVEFGGDVVPGAEIEPPSSEAIGLAVAVLVLLVSFGSVLAMGLPLLTALIGLGVGLTGITLLSAFVDLSSTAPTLATMIGLAVGIDYALFVITRHRQNIAEGIEVEEAAARANATAGSAVVFAGLTVVIALAGLAVMGLPFITVMGLAAAATVLVAVLVAVTLLPAMLGFAGHNIDRFRVPGLKNRTGGMHEGATMGSRWAGAVTRRPVISLIGGVVFMGVLAIPLTSMRLGLTDAGSEPPSTTQRQAYDLLAEGFGPGFNGPLTIVADLSGVTDPEAALSSISDVVAAQDGILSVAPPQLNETGETAVLAAIPSTSPSSVETEDLIGNVRDGAIRDVETETGARVFVTGSTAANIDISDKLANALPWFMALVIGLTLLLMMAVFRSILVPIKAAIAILISIGAAFGVTVAVFQWGWLNEVIGVEEPLAIVSFLPMMMFAILFGLSMDYEVFILSRIREDFVHNGNPRNAVLTGITSSARVITAAALIMVSVFGAFVLGDNAIIKMFGIGLSVAVLLDATVVRMIIVPAVMTLFDKAAWWLPRRLDRILPNLDIEGEQLIEELQAKDAEAHARRTGVDQDEDAEPALV